MSIFKKIFGHVDVLKEGIEIIKDAGDALVYTDEEKAKDNAKRSEQIDKLLINWLETTKGANIARRWIAVIVAGIWSFLFIFSWVATQLAIWLSDKKEKVEAMVAANASFLDMVTGAMMLVLGFYFAAPFMGDIAKGALERFGGNRAKD